MKRILLLLGVIGFLAEANFAQQIPFTRKPLNNAVNTPEYFPLPNAAFVDIGDANNDGYLDLLTTGQYAGQVITFTWNPSLNRYDMVLRPGNTYDNGVWGNFDKNDTLDVLVSSRAAGQELTVFMNNYAGSQIKITDPGVEGITFTSLHGVQAVDFDNDGDDDIVVGKYEAGADLFFFRNDDLNFVLSHTIKDPFGWVSARLINIRKADFDGDGFMDIVVSNENWPNVNAFKVFKSNGDGTFTDVYTATVDEPNDGRYQSFEVADINGDGKMDFHSLIYLSAEQRYTVAFWMNDGNMSFTRTYKSMITKGIGGFALADFNNDNKLDIAYYEGTWQDTAAVVLGDGAGNFTDIAYVDVLDEGYYLSSNVEYMAYDVNKDGKVDIVNINSIHFNDLVTETPRGLRASYSFTGNFEDETGESDGTNHGAVFGPDRDGKENSALFFDGVDAYVDLGDLNMPDKGEMHDSLTITMWVKIAEDSPSGGIFTRRVIEGHAYMSLFYNDPGAPIWDAFPTTVPTLAWMVNGPFYFNPVEAKTEPTKEKWHYLAISKLGNKTIMYMDGAKIDSAADSYDYTYNGSYTGFGNGIIGINPAWRTETNKAAFKGYIDDIKVYNGALKDEEIQESYQEEHTNQWTAMLDVVQGEFSAKAHFGMNENATDGLDQQLDTPEPPEASGNNVRAWFAHPEWNGTLGDNYIADIRKFKSLENISETWNLSVKTTISGEGSITLTRPPEFPYPIVVKSGTMSWISRDGNILIPFTSDGSTTMQYEIMAVGDNTPPVLTVSGNFEGPAIWDNTKNRELSWEVTEANLEYVSVEYTTNGTDWTPVYKGKDQNNVMFDVPEWNRVHTLKFKVQAVDIAMNKAEFMTMYPISVVSPVQELPYAAGWNMRGLSYMDLDMENSTFTQTAFLFDWMGFHYAPKMMYHGAEGYWLGSYESGSETVKGTVVETNVKLKSHAGWSMVASPLMRPVNTDSIKVKNLSDDQVYSYADALTAELVTHAFGYNSGEGYSLSPVMEPFKGYWLGVLADSVEFEIPIHHHAPVVTKGRNVTETVNIAAIAMEDGNHITAVAFGTDVPVNIPTPPSAPNTQSLGMLGKQTILGNVYYSMMVNAELGAEIPLTTSGDAREIVLSWQAQSFSDGMVYELHGSNGEVFSLSESGDYIWNTGDENAPKLVVVPFGTSNEVQVTELPTEVNLSQNYPNPFNPSTSIRFALPESGTVQLSVFNLLGQKVATLVNEVKPAGYHTVQFDASKLSSGVYLYRIETAGISVIKQMLLIK